MCLAFFHYCKLRHNLSVLNSTDPTCSDEWVSQFYTLMVTPKETRWWDLQHDSTELQEGEVAAYYPREAIASDSCITCSWSSNKWNCTICFLLCLVFCSPHHIFEIRPGSCVMLFISTQFHESTTICLSIALLIDSWIVCHLWLLGIRCFWTSLNKSFGYLFSFILGRYIGEKMLDQKLHVWLYKKLPKNFP